MRLNRTAAAIGGAGLLAAWLAAAWTDPFPSTRPASPAAEETLQGPSQIELEGARLRQRLTAKPALEPMGRNPFRFASRERSATVSRRVNVAEPAADLPPPPPPLQLAGIAEDNGAGGAARTAILSTDGEVFLVREGDDAAGRYRVTRIAADAIELQDLVTGEPVVLSLP